MNKYDLVGLILAFVLLCAALIFKFAGGEGAVVIALPLLTIVLAALTAVDTVAYRKSSKASKRAELLRLISLYILTALFCVGTVLYFVFR